MQAKSAIINVAMNVITYHREALCNLSMHRAESIAPDYVYFTPENGYNEICNLT